MRLDVMTAADKYGCNHETIRRLFKRGGIEGRYETAPGRNGAVQRRLTFDEADLEAAFAGPLVHLRERASGSRASSKAVAKLSPSERKHLEARFDVHEAARRHSCSEARIRQSFKTGALSGEYTMAPGRDGRLVRKLTFDKDDLDACFGRELSAQDRHDAHVAKIRATAVPFTDSQKKAIGSVFIDHLREKRAAELAAAENPEEPDQDTDSEDGNDDVDHSDEDMVDRVRSRDDLVSSFPS